MAIAPEGNAVQSFTADVAEYAAGIAEAVRESEALIKSGDAPEDAGP